MNGLFDIAIGFFLCLGALEFFYSYYKHKNATK